MLRRTTRRSDGSIIGQGSLGEECGCGTEWRVFVGELERWSGEYDVDLVLFRYTFRFALGNDGSLGPPAKFLDPDWWYAKAGQDPLHTSRN
jgi:hypothetical protein